MIAHGLPPRPGWPLPGLQDPLDQQRVLGECSVNVSNSCREICRATAYTMSSLFKSTPRTLPITQPEATLDNFLAWRTRELVGRQAHDNVQLIT